MKKFTNFERIKRDGWPDPEELRHYFFAPPGQEWFHTGGNDTAGLSAEGLYGTEHEDHLTGHRVDLDLYIFGIPSLGVQLGYRKYGGGYHESYTSKGDMS